MKGIFHGDFIGLDGDENIGCPGDSIMIQLGIPHEDIIPRIVKMMRLIMDSS